MKYFVTVAGREIEVEVDGELVTVEGRQLHASLHVVPGTPLRHLTLDGRSHLLAVESLGSALLQREIEVRIRSRRTWHQPD